MLLKYLTTFISFFGLKNIMQRLLTTSVCWKPTICRLSSSQIQNCIIYISVFKLIKSYTPLYCTRVATYFIILFIWKIYKNKVFAYKCYVHTCNRNRTYINMLKLAFVFRQLYVEIKLVRTTLLIVCINKVVHLPKMKKKYYNFKSDVE